MQELAQEGAAVAEWPSGSGSTWASVGGAAAEVGASRRPLSRTTVPLYPPRLHPPRHPRISWPPTGCRGSATSKTPTPGGRPAPLP